MIWGVKNRSAKKAVNTVEAIVPITHHRNFRPLLCFSGSVMLPPKLTRQNLGSNNAAFLDLMNGKFFFRKLCVASPYLGRTKRNYYAYPGLDRPSAACAPFLPARINANPRRLHMRA